MSETQQLIIEGNPVIVTVDSSMGSAPFGDFDRAFSGRMRSDLRGHHRSPLRFTTTPDSYAKSLALQSLLQSPGPLLCEGELIGAPADFHAVGVALRPLSGDMWTVAFELHETETSTTPLLFSFRADAPGDYTFTRNSLAYYRDEEGVIREAAVNEARLSAFTPIDGEERQVYLGEVSRSNLITSLDVTTWPTGANPPEITTGIPDPAGGTAAFLISDTDTGSLEFVSNTVSFTGDGRKAFSVFIKEGNNLNNASIKIYDSTAALDRAKINITAFVDGVPEVTAANGTILAIVPYVDGWWRIEALSDPVTAANSNRFQILPGSSTATGDLYVFWPQTENSVVCSSPIPAASSRAEDFLQVPVAFAPSRIKAHQGITVLTEWVERGTALLTATSPRYWQIGGTGIGDDPRFGLNSLNSTSGEIQVFFDDGVTLATCVTPAGTVTIGDHVRARVTIFWEDGAWRLQLHYSINGSEESSTSSSRIGTRLPAAWSADTLTVGIDPEAGSEGITLMRGITMVGGVRSLDEMTVWSAARLHRRAA